MKFLVGRSSLQRPCKYLKYLSFVYYGCPSPFILYLNFFPENLKNKVKRLLISQVKNHSCRKTCKSVEVSLVLPEKP